MLPGWSISLSPVHCTKSIYCVDSTLGPMPFCAHCTGEGHCFFVPFLLIFRHLQHLHRTIASTSPSCAGLFPPLPLPHSPDLCCALPPAGACSCPGPLWGAGSLHPLSPNSLPSLWAQWVPGSSEQASPPVLAAGRRLLRFLTLWPVAQRWSSPPRPSLSCPR